MAINQKFPQLPPPVFNLLEWLTELREVFICIHHSITEHQSQPPKSDAWGSEVELMQKKIKFIINAMYLNHPETTLPKIIFHKTGPWNQKVWGTAVKGHYKENIWRTRWRDQKGFQEWNPKNVSSTRASVLTLLACVSAITNWETNQISCFMSFYRT